MDSYSSSKLLIPSRPYQGPINTNRSDTPSNSSIHTIRGSDLNYEIRKPTSKQQISDGKPQVPSVNLTETTGAYFYNQSVEDFTIDQSDYISSNQPTPYKNKIQVPLRGYCNKSVSSDSASIMQSGSVVEGGVCQEIKKKIDLMRETIKKRLKKKMKSFLYETLGQLKQLDELERYLYSQLNVANTPTVVDSSLDGKFYQISHMNPDRYSLDSSDNFDDSSNFEVESYKKSKPKSKLSVEEKSKLDERKKKYKQERKKFKPDEEKQKIAVEIKIQPETEKKISIEENKTDKELSISKLSNQSRLGRKPIAEQSLIVSLQPGTVLISKDLEIPEQYTIPFYTKGMSVLALSHDILLFAGGLNNESFIYNVDTKVAKKYPKLTTNRTFFVLGMINNCPAAIGGLKPPSSVTNIVEIFENGQWKLFDPLIIGRSHAHAIQHGEITYVFGGHNGGINMKIEKYDSKWVLLDVELPVPMRNFGLGSWGKEIYMFGGEVTGNKRKNVFKLNVDALVFTICPSLGSAFSTINPGSIISRGSKFYLLDSWKCMIMEYQLQAICDNERY
ncbi:hypothetical protein SteCoe_7117 [Stentor coeruleus]|uniref:Kelch motif family protein n=1 Tax=Stentor coeruleus TaxID=5963 RepID=A0A1R2CND0_9CILI|nr:hypothetical protein SteCoe_7117 [Stentor coeruleus]